MWIVRSRDVHGALTTYGTDDFDYAWEVFVTCVAGGITHIWIEGVKHGKILSA